MVHASESSADARPPETEHTRIAAQKAVVGFAPRETAEPEEVIAQCGERLAKNKWLRSIDFLAELPRNPTGKVLKHELRAPWWEGRDRSI